MRVPTLFICTLMLLLPLTLLAQNRPLSPPANAATEVGGEWDTSGQRPQYTGGKWIEIEYSAPILRLRGDIFGSGDNYGTQVLAGAPVWRAGANKSTRLKTEADLEIGGKVVKAGEYSLFIELKGSQDWELIVSTYGAVDAFPKRDESNLWGAYGYTDAKDVTRAKMDVEVLDGALIDQLGWGFTGVTKTGGTLCVWWAKSLACTPVSVAN